MSAAATADNEPKEGVPPRAHVALLPIIVTLAAIVWMFIRRGEAAHDTHVFIDQYLVERPLQGVEHLRAVLKGVEDNTRLLFYGSLIGLGTVVVLTVGERLLTVAEAARAAVSGTRTMLAAVSILLLAWAMSAVCEDLGTREYMAALSSLASPLILPAALFFLACGVSFATGSSWSTMGILLPIVIELAAKVGSDAAVAAGTDPTVGATAMVVMTIGAVLDGSIFGDHCSPISDTTILSSTATGSDHMDHVITQVPYALTVMLVAVTCGYLPAAAGVPPGIALGLGATVLVFIALGVGKRLDR